MEEAEADLVWEGEDYPNSPDVDTAEEAQTSDADTMQNAPIEHDSQLEVAGVR